MEDKKKKKRFNIFDWYYRQGKGNDKDDINALKDPSIINFFKLTGSKLGKLISSNLIMVFGNFPLFFILIAMSNILSESSIAPLCQNWGPLYGASIHDNTQTISALLGAFIPHSTISVINTPTIVFYCLGALLLFTWGPTKTATSYLYRNMMSAEPVFPFSDAIYIIKKNIKQSIILGIIDALITCMFAYNIYFLTLNYNASTLNAFMLFLTVAMAILYSFAIPYAYIMVYTFDLKLTKIIKNSMLFTILGIKRNLVRFGGTIAIIALNLLVFYILMPLGALLPFIITFAICDFMSVYSAYPNIIKYMLDEEDAQALIEHTPATDETYEE